MRRVGIVADIGSNVAAWWGPFLALAAGVVSFVSPCVLPLVPGYLAFVTGGDEPAADTKFRLLPLLLFILGFSLVFTVVAGFTASAISGWLRSESVQRVAGVVVLGFGVFLVLYALRLGLPGLYRESRPFLTRVKPGPAAALPLGMAFAVGWTPCIGPVLGAILTLAASQASTPRAILLLAFYSLGLGLPFLLIGIGVRRLMGAFRFLTRNYHWIAGASGVALSVIGVLLLTGIWTKLLNPLLRLVNRFTPAI
jgi:cytochrome c-type biogenesis protein